ncbi:MAG: secretin N-terminal domain-containing protein [Pararobbsia sp.]
MRTARIVFFYTTTRVFQVIAIPGDSKLDTNVVSGASNTGGTSSGNGGAAGGGGGGGGGGQRRRGFGLGRIADGVVGQHGEHHDERPTLGSIPACRARSSRCCRRPARS